MARRAQGELELGDLSRPLVRVTPTKLDTWSSCRRRYRMAYLDRPRPTRGGAWAHTTLGAVVHTALQALFDLAPGQRRAHAAAALVATHWSGEGFADDAQAADYRSRAQDWVSRYVDELDPYLEPVGVERWVSAPTQRIVAEGRVDRIDERDGELVVVDYKTGRHELTVDDARTSPALALYAFATGHTLRRACRRVELHHLPTGIVAGWEHTEQSLRRHLQRAEETAEEIALATDALATGRDPEILFPPEPGRACSWCDFRRHCPEGQASAPDLAPWALLAP